MLTLFLESESEKNHIITTEGDRTDGTGLEISGAAFFDSERVSV